MTDNSRNTPKNSRREFLKSSAAIVSATGLGALADTPGYAAGSGTIKVGVIGSGAIGPDLLFYAPDYAIMDFFKPMLGVLDDVGLKEDRGGCGIDAGRQPVDHHLAGVPLDIARVLVVRGQRVPVGDEEKAVVLELKLNPVIKHAV